MLSVLFSFAVLKEELQSGEDEAKCPSCSLLIKVIYDIVSYIVIIIVLLVSVSSLFICP